MSSIYYSINKISIDNVILAWLPKITLLEILLPKKIAHFSGYVIANPSIRNVIKMTSIIVT